ncbi:low temperature requirement protein A [Microbispora cellulosiformans]|uniref:Low temperature requirement protein A n=1 Tax=Microbispora cellulosiformans TaxID=2614688 RepID=A0A5J5K819_9ACTN|nr:low temperature requirement protein A [Microbispora cellulosiformans]KAA9380904.1 low temperature requirement protein A [Microbispora cellulosiformans]
MPLPRWFAERVEPTAPDAELRVSTVELFFDLVFVFTITQLTSLVVGDFTRQDGEGFAGQGTVQAVLIFGLLWWMYSGYAWLTNTVPPERTARRVLILCGMAGFLIMALAIPHAFSGSGVAFAVGYLVIVLVHGGLYLQATAAIARVVPFNLAATALVLAAAFVAPPWNLALWAAALVLVWMSPIIIGQKGFPLHPAHIVERHGLLVIIVLGESIVAIGIGATDGHPGAALIVTALLGLALTAALWWVYFGHGESGPEHALAQAGVVQRTRLILGAYFYAHVPILLGIVATAAGIKKAVGHDHLAPGPAVALSAGTALFLLGDLWFRRVLGEARRGRRLAVRLAAALLAAAAVPIGQWSPAAHLGALVVLVIAMICMENVL